MAKQIITASTDTASGLGYFLTKLWAKIKATFYTKTETDTKLNSKQATISGGASTITSSNLTASRALISNSSGKVAVSDVTSTELGYLDGVTSNVQTQLNEKAASSDLDDYLPLAGGTVTGNIVLDTNAKIYKHKWTNDYCYFYIIDNDTSTSTDTSYHTLILNIKAVREEETTMWGQIVFKNSFGKPVISTAREFAFVGTPFIGYSKISDYKWVIKINSNSNRGVLLSDIQLTTRGNWTIEYATSAPSSASFTAFDFCLVYRKYGLGSSTQPVYYKTNSGSDEGVLDTCSTYAGGTKVTLNGTDKGASTASFYAPTAVGSKYNILTSNGSGAPSWANTISPDAIELYRGGSTSAGHGGYIDFHYNASTDDYTSRIIEYSNYIGVLGKLMIQSGTKYLEVGDSYTVTSTDGYYFIRSDAANTITVPAGSGIPNRNLYVLSMIVGSTLTYHTYRINDFAMGDVSLIMIPGKVYHLIAFDGDTWCLMNDVDNEHNTRDLSVVANSTLADLYVRNIVLSPGIILTLPKSQAIQDRELMIYCSNTGAYPQIKYQVPAEADTYSTMTLAAFHCVKFIALGGYWYPMVNA